MQNCSARIKKVKQSCFTHTSDLNLHHKLWRRGKQRKHNSTQHISKSNWKIKRNLTVAFCKIQQYNFLAMHLFITPIIYRYKIIFHYYFLMLLSPHLILLISHAFENLSLKGIELMLAIYCFWKVNLIQNL